MVVDRCVWTWEGAVFQWGLLAPKFCSFWEVREGIVFGPKTSAEVSRHDETRGSLCPMFKKWIIF